MRGLALFAVIALLVAGCGGGSAETTTRDETQLNQPSPKSDYLSLADAICRNHRSRQTDLEDQAAELGPISSPAKAHQIADLLRKEADNRMAEVRELDALQPPPAEAVVVGPILSGIRAEGRLIKIWADTYDDLDLERTRRLQIRLGVITAETERRAQAFGFSVCGQV